ncbi:hypothetical protein C8J57DRAFT_1248593 [Mycena rebaudengoi]|nr:hypothetical protein C8J57DRAFT_1248593 [Mycena rebaudengoi]
MAFSAESRTVWINPSRALLDQVFPLPVPGTDRITFENPYTQILPGLVDENRMVRAFEKALTFYPHASGRWRTNGPEWMIEAGVRGVSLTLANVNQPLDHYEYPAQFPSHIIDSITTDILVATDMWRDEPLMRVKVTFCRTTNETYIGWSSNHILGDAEFCFQFMHAWSNFYQGKKPTFPPPTKYRTAPPDELNDNPDTDKFLSRYLKHLKVLHPMEKWMSMLGEVVACSVQVDLLFTGPQVLQLREIADSYPGRRGARASTQDTLSSYLIMSEKSHSACNGMVQHVTLGRLRSASKAWRRDLEPVSSCLRLGVSYKLS